MDWRAVVNEATTQTWVEELQSCDCMTAEELEPFCLQGEAISKRVDTLRAQLRLRPESLIDIAACTLIVMNDLRFRPLWEDRAVAANHLMTYQDFRMLGEILAGYISPI